MLTTNWIPSLSLYTSPKHFTSTLRPKTSQLALELLYYIYIFIYKMIIEHKNHQVLRKIQLWKLIL